MAVRPAVDGDGLDVACGVEPAAGERAAEFLIDSSGTVRWVNLTGSFTVRARPDQVLKVVDDLGLASTSRS